MNKSWALGRPNGLFRDNQVTCSHYNNTAVNDELSANFRFSDTFCQRDLFCNLAIRLNVHYSFLVPHLRDFVTSLKVTFMHASSDRLKLLFHYIDPVVINLSRVSAVRDIKPAIKRFNPYSGQSCVHFTIVSLRIWRHFLFTSQNVCAIQYPKNFPVSFLTGTLLPRQNQEPYTITITSTAVVIPM